MRRIFGALMMIPVILLAMTGCSGANDGEELCSLFSTIQEVEITGDITVDYGDRCHEFTLSYSGDCQEGIVTVLEPESIAGTELEISGGRVKMRVNDVKLDSGELDGQGLAPITILPTVTKALKDGYLVEYSETEFENTACVRLIYQLGDTDQEHPLLCSIWVEKETEVPVYAEISVNGSVIVTCDILEFSAVTSNEQVK